MAATKLDTYVRRKQIAHAALEVVAAKGLNKLSVAAVARRVGLVPSALYRHFKSKDELLDATLELIQEKLMSNVEAVLEQSDDALEQLRRLLMLHAAMIRDNRGIPQIMFSRDFYADRPDRRSRVYRGIRDYLGEVAGIIRRGRKAGQIGRQVDAGVASVVFLGLIQPSAVLWHMSGGEFNAMRQARRAWPLFLKAIQVEGSGGI